MHTNLAPTVVDAFATSTESSNTGVFQLTSQMLTLLPWTLRTLQLVV